MFSFLFDPINISLIVTALLNLFLGALVFAGGRNKKINIVFSLNIVAVISWTIAMLLYRSAIEEANLFWVTVLYVTPTFIASSFLYFTYIFPSQKEKYIWWRAILIFGINLAIIVIVIWPGFIIKEVNMRPVQEKEIIFTSYYWFYFLYTFSFFTFGFYRLFRKYLKTKGIERLQIIYFLSGYAISANLAFSTNLIMPWIGYFYLNWLGQVFTLIGVASTTYAILKYRLMDIRIVVRKVFVYFGMAGLAYGVFYLIAWLYSRAFGDVFARPGYVLGLIIAPLFVLSFYWLDRRIKIISNKYFFTSLYYYQETINNLSQKLNYLNDLDEIVGLIVDTVKQSMQLDKAGVLLVNEKDGKIYYKIAKVIGFNENNGISLVQDNFLTRRLQETQKLLVREELSLLAKDSNSLEDKKGFAELGNNMKRIEASLCLPLMSSKKLIGIIVLGSKISGDAYSEEDLELLNTLAYQAGIAVDNARLYEEIQDLNENLQQKVDEQTKEIREQKEKVEKAYEVEKQAHEELKKVDDTKSQFMVIVNHHLRTPLTAINWYTDLLLSGKYGKIPKKSEEVINKIKEATSDEIKIVNDLLDVSQFQLGTDIVSLKPDVNVKDMLNRIIQGIEPEAGQREVDINLKIEESVPNIIADESKLKIALSNILANAVKYTEKGKVAVTISNTQNPMPKILIVVQDTGIGMSESEIKNLFVKTFERGGDAQKMNAIGKGIGLYISAKIIEAHNGKIWAESGGRGKGSAFFIELPVLK